MATLPCGHNRLMAILVAAVCLAGGVARGDGLRPLPSNDPTNAEGLPAALEGVGIDPQPGVQLPLDVALTSQDGHPARLGDYVGGDKPTLLVFAYYACPMLCTLVLNGMVQAIKGLPWSIGQDFRVLVVSFDPRDTLAVAAEKRTNYLASYRRPVGPRDWDFTLAQPDQIARLTAAAGFRYRWDEGQQQYAHAAGLYFLTPQGQVSRVLTGVSFDPKDVRMALSDASGGKVSTLTERILLFCFHYEPSLGKYVLAAKQAMRVSGLVSVVAMVVFLRTLFRRERTRAST